MADIPEILKEDSVVCQRDTRAIRGMKIVFLQSARKISVGMLFVNNIRYQESKNLTFDCDSKILYWIYLHKFMLNEKFQLCFC